MCIKAEESEDYSCNTLLGPIYPLTLGMTASDVFVAGEKSLSEICSRAVEEDAADDGTAGLVSVESLVSPGPHSVASLASEDIFPTG